MIATFFQSIGFVFSCIVVIILAVLTLYLSYILAIGILIIGFVYVVYVFITMYKSATEKPP